MLELASWNGNPNRVWWVRLSDASTGIRAEVYLSQADAEAQTDMQAAGESTGYGTAVEITLTNESGATEPVSLFQEIHDWHLTATGAASDPVQIYQIKDFVTLDDISDPIYRNEDLITTRSAAEINAHTHAVLTKDIELGSHIPTLEPGNVVQMTSARRGKTELLQVMEHRITGTVSDGGEMSLTSSISAATYLQLKR